MKAAVRSLVALPVWSLLAWGLVAGPAAGQTEPELAELVREARAESGVEGLSVVFVDAAGDLHTAISGEQRAGELREGVPMTPDAAFEIGSVSKIFTATLALRAEREGLLSLEDPLARWFPEVPNAEEIRIGDLLRHTSGMDDPLQRPGFVTRYFIQPEQAPDAEGIVAAVGDPEFPPGEGWKYSNAGFIAVALILERVSDRSYGDLLEGWIAEPLGISGLRSIHWNDELGPLAHGHRDLAGQGEFVDMSAFADFVPFRAATVGAGSIVATAPALARALSGLRASILTGEEWTRMQQWVDRPDGHRYGLGLLRVEDQKGRVLVGHRGNSSGYSGEAWWLPEGEVLVVLANRGGISVHGIAQKVLDGLTARTPSGRQPE